MYDIIIDDIIEEAKKYGNVVSIKLEVGEIAPLLVEEIELLIREKTNWKVETEIKTSAVKCTCGYNGPAQIIKKGSDYTLFSCPRCNSLPRVIDGENIDLKEVRVL